jgi:glyoxylase-like metal-dependent hydrolase (beta-lactamase superfamily II)
MVAGTGTHAIFADYHAGVPCRFGPVRSSHGTDCNVYLIDGGSEHLMIDGGSGLGFAAIIENIAQAGFDPGRVTTVVNTHSDWDHAGGDYLRQGRFGVTVVAAPSARAVLEDSLWSHPMLRDVPMAPLEHMTPADDGLVVQTGSQRVQLLYAPGHTLDHLAISLDTELGLMLFTGDLVDGNGRLGLIKLGNAVLSYSQSLTRLQQLARRPASFLGTACSTSPRRVLSSEPRLRPCSNPGLR